MQEAKTTGTPTLELHFDGALAIVGGGRVDFELLAALAGEGVGVVAADGGADMCAKAGVTPDAIIGDMDSIIGADGFGPDVPVFRIAEQETTDFEKCLYSTRSPVTLALGMTGGRFDHTLAALTAMARHGRDRAILLVDEEDVALAVSGPISFSVAAGERVSVHPLEKVTFARSEGLVYPLDGLTLDPAAKTGTSNVAPAGAFSITPDEGEDGVWLLIVARSHLAALTDAVSEQILSPPKDIKKI